MIDIFLDEDYDLVFSGGDLQTIDVDTDMQYQDLSIILNIDAGHNKQFPNIGCAIYKSINGKESDLFSSIISNAKSCGITVKQVYIDIEKKIQILI
jgi:5-enolpyruvylshikimate-3-phosphate synthase